MSIADRALRGARGLGRRIVPRSVRRRLHPPKLPWVVTEPNPVDADLLDSFGFYAIVGTWMEADIIADTVANALAQGIDRVFVADNDSPDDTSARAVAAGAELALVYATERFEERYRYVLMNELVQHVSEASDHDHIWWLWLDADEFSRPEGPGRLREMLAGLDRKFRIVGARVVNHYPTPGEVAHVEGVHPVVHQPMCEEVPEGICGAMHRKHPLQRWDREGPRIDADLGFHRANCEHRPLIEPAIAIVMHHVPYRNESVSRARLNRLWQNRDDGTSRAIEGDIATDHMQARFESMDAVYAGEWTKIRNFLPGAPDSGVALVDWRSLLPPIHPELASWSPPAVEESE